jgi:hypothetical protein
MCLSSSGLRPRWVEPKAPEPDVLIDGGRKQFRLLALLGTAFVALLIAIWTAAASRKTPLDRFWNPVIGSQSVLLCIPDRFSSMPDANAAFAVGRSAGSGLTSTTYDRNQLFQQRNHVFLLIHSL